MASQVLDIYVEDVNDLPPRFDPAIYELNVTENLPALTFVGQVIAVDGDSGKLIYLLGVGGVYIGRGGVYIGRGLSI